MFYKIIFFLAFFKNLRYFNDGSRFVISYSTESGRLRSLNRYYYSILTIGRYSFYKNPDDDVIFWINSFVIKNKNNFDIQFYNFINNEKPKICYYEK